MTANAIRAMLAYMANNAINADVATSARSRAYRLPCTKATEQLFGAALRVLQRRGATDLRVATVLREGLRALSASVPAEDVEPPAALRGAERLRRARMAVELSQGRLASDVGATRSYVANVEQGKAALCGRLLAWVEEQEARTR